MVRAQPFNTWGGVPSDNFFSVIFHKQILFRGSKATNYFLCIIEDSINELT